MNLVRTVAKVATAFFLVTCISCENEQDITVGSEVLPGSTLQFKEVEIENAVTLTQVSANRVQTNNLPYYRLGKSDNAKYDLVVKSRPGDVSTIQGASFYKFKSAKMVLSYRFKDTTKTVEENTVAYHLKRGRQQKDMGEVRVKLHKLKQIIQSVNPSLAFENRYFSDGWRNGREDLRFPWTGDDLEELTEVSIEPPFTDDFIEVSTLGDLNTSGTSLVVSKNVEASRPVENKTTAVSIDLTESPKFLKEYFGEERLDAETLRTKAGLDFQREFQAFYLEVIEGETNNVLEVLPNDFSADGEAVTPVVSRLEVVFDVVDDNGNSIKVKDENENDTETDQEYYLSFPLTNNSSFGEGEAAQAINLITDLGDANSVNDNQIYLKNGIGSVAQLKLFSGIDSENNKNMLESLFDGNTINEFNKNAIISRAVLRFTAKGVGESYPERLVLNRHMLPQGSSNVSLFLTDFNDNVSGLSLLEGNHLIGKQEISGNTVYDIVITEHLQSILNSEKLETTISQNFDMTLGIFNREDRIVALPAFKTNGSSAQNFYMLESSLFSDEEVIISNSNELSETSLKPKLIVKFTPTN